MIDAADPVLQEPTDALVRVVRACVCGSDLHPYHAMPADPDGWHAAIRGGVTRGSTVTVIGDGAVGLLAVISRVRVPQYDDAPIGFGSLFGPNVTLTGGPAPVRAYVEQLLPAVLDGTVNPGRVFDRTVSLGDTPAGYEAMDNRSALKVAVRP